MSTQTAQARAIETESKPLTTVAASEMRLAVADIQGLLTDVAESSNTRHGILSMQECNTLKRASLTLAALSLRGLDDEVAKIWEE